MIALRRRLTGLLALLLILGIIIGLPMVLLAVGANPFGSGIPSLEAIKNALTAPDDGTLALGLVKVVGWASWAFLTVSILLEAISEVRGVRAPRLPCLRLPQNAARGLVGTAMMLFVAVPMGAGAASAAPVTHVQPAATSTVVAGDHAKAPASSTASTSKGPTSAEQKTNTEQPPAPKTVSHTVKRGETLWSIAQTKLGDGHRFTEIVALNPDVLHGKSSFIKAGWVLDIPAPAEHVRAGERVVVEKGDTLSEIALDELGDASRYPAIFQASRGITQPGGAHLTDPDVIDVGWTVQLPSTPTTDKSADKQGTPQRPTPESATPQQEERSPGAGGHQQAPTAQGGEQGAETQTPSVTQPTAPQREQPAPAATQSPTSAQTAPQREQPAPAATQSPTSAQTAPQQEQHPSATTATEEHLEEDSAWMVRTSYGVGALLAAGVLARIATRRRTQQRRRRPGQRLPMPEGRTAQTERELRATADSLSVEAVDIALRCLARDCGAAGTALPVVRAARLTATQFDLYLAEPAQLPAPWTGTADTTVWTLEVDNTTDLDADVAGVPAPYPALVTIGHDEEDGHVFLDLEYLGALGVAGEPLATREIIAALAIELATSSWADDLQVTIVGAFPELEDTLQTGRIRYLPSVGRILDDLTHRAEEDRLALAAENTPDLQHARVIGAAPDAWSPEIVLLAGDITDRQRKQLEQLADDLPRVALAAVTVGVPVGEWGLDLSAGDGPDLAVLSPIGLQIYPQRLPAEQYGHLLEMAVLADVDELDGDTPPAPTLVDVESITPVDEPAAPASAMPTTPELTVEALEAAAARSDGHPTSSQNEPNAAPVDVDETPTAAPGTSSGGAGGVQLATSAASASPTDLPTGGVFLPDTAHVTTDAPIDEQQPTQENAAQPKVDADLQDVEEPETTRAPEADVSTAPETLTPEEAPVQPIPRAAPKILVLGPVDMVNANGKVEPTKRARLLEYAAYLALTPGATHTAIDDAIWPDRKAEDNLTTRNPATSKLRRWVGLSPEGKDYLPRHQAGEGYAFLPAVTTDAGDWDTLLAGDPLNASTENLETALHLVRGIPFEGTHRRRYAWAEPIKQRLISEIVDASYELARRRLMEGRWRTAEQAVVVGLRIEPAQENLWRVRILAAHESRNPAAETEAIERLLTITDQLECELEPETEQLLAALKNPGADFDQLMATAL